MSRHLLIAVVAVLTISANGCTHSRPRAETPVTAPSAGSTAAAPTSPQSSSSPSSSRSGAPNAVAIGRYLQIARAALPSQDTPTLIRTAHTICTNLGHNLSLHDAVGDLAARTGNQVSAQHTVDAAISAYCPNLPAR